MIRCAKCKEVKNINEFSPFFQEKTNGSCYCKGCVKIKNAERRPLKEKGNKWRLSLLLENKKYCGGCSSIKELTDFSKNSKRSSGLSIFCKACKSKSDKKHREKLKKLGVYKDRKRKDYLKHHDKRLANMLDYNKNRRNYKTEYQTTIGLWRKNPLAKIRHSVRNRLLVGLKFRGFKKNSKSIEILGADWNTIKTYIEDLFTDGMTWDNHGKGNGKWHFDHRIPLASAKTEEEFYILCHYTNMQPMWEIDNLRKGTQIFKNP
jgi:hypothetical protein